MTKKTFKTAWSKCANDQIKKTVKKDQREGKPRKTFKSPWIPLNQDHTKFSPQKEELSNSSTDSTERLIKIEMMLTMMNNSFFHLSNQLSEIKHLIKCNSDK